MMAREQGFPQWDGRIGDRCERLIYVGFVAPLHAEMYQITQWGRLYLEGEIDARYRETPTVERALR